MLKHQIMVQSQLGIKRPTFFFLVFVLLFAACAGILQAQNTGDGEPSHKDHRAIIAAAYGKARILKYNRQIWQEAKKGMLIEEGDQLLTGPESHVDISYDKTFSNVARIEENTRAEFISIEPTEVHLEDGSVFNVLEGLESEEKYRISTPTAVAGVRSEKT